MLNCPLPHHELPCILVNLSPPRSGCHFLNFTVAFPERYQASTRRRPIPHPTTRTSRVPHDTVYPILHIPHSNTDTLRQSKSQAIGDGLHTAKLGEAATISILVEKAEMNGTNRAFVFSVLAVGESHIFSAKQSGITPDGSVVNFTYTATLPGEYDLYIEQANHTSQFQVSGSPFRLLVNGSIDKAYERERADQLPSCQTVPQNDTTWIKGSWVTRDLAGTKRGTLRSGWVFQPSRCSFDIFSKRDVELASQTQGLKTIAILGSSILRGIFLSILDVILTKEEKSMISASDFDKCWGYAELKLGNLKLINQDFRIERFGDVKMEINRHVGLETTCHNEKLVNKGTYELILGAKGFWRETLFGYNKSWPDVIVVAIGDDTQLMWLLNAVPVSWNGTIYPLYNFNPKVMSLFTAFGFLESDALAKRLVSLDKRVQLLDGFTMATGMRHTTQSSPLIVGSLHWHHYCNELDGEIRVCSNPTEMMAQLLLGKVLAPNGKYLSGREYDVAGNINQNNIKTSRREIKVCYDCPKTLLPFHIKMTPNVTCYTSTTGILPSKEKNFEVWDGNLCPKECLKTRPIGIEQTGSGPVDVRICRLPYS